MVLVDTSVWSLALRQRAVDLSSTEHRLTQALYELISQNQALLLGPIRQEVLSGIREKSQFRRIREHLRDFPDVELEAIDYEGAADISNQCRSVGVASSPVDVLLCAVSRRNHWQIFTTDDDFLHYQRVVQLNLLVPR